MTKKKEKDKKKAVWEEKQRKRVGRKRGHRQSYEEGAEDMRPEAVRRRFSVMRREALLEGSLDSQFASSPHLRKQATAIAAVMASPSYNVLMASLPPGVRVPRTLKK